MRFNLNRFALIILLLIQIVALIGLFTHSLPNGTGLIISSNLMIAIMIFNALEN